MVSLSFGLRFKFGTWSEYGLDLGFISELEFFVCDRFKAKVNVEIKNYFFILSPLVTY